MYPYIEIFGKEITSYGLMAGIGCVVVFVLSMIRIKKTRSSLDDSFFLSVLFLWVQWWVQKFCTSFSI